MFKVAIGANTLEVDTIGVGTDVVVIVTIVVGTVIGTLGKVTCLQQENSLGLVMPFLFLSSLERVSIPGLGFLGRQLELGLSASTSLLTVSVVIGIELDKFSTS